MNDPTPASTSGPKRTTRATTGIFGLPGGLVTDRDAELPHTRLPTGLQVLRCVMFFLDKAAKEKRPGATSPPTSFVSAQLVADMIVPIYAKAGIPMVSQARAATKIVHLLDENKRLRAISIKRRETEAIQRRVKQSEEALQRTFDLWPPNPWLLIKKEADRAFLRSMMTDRTATMASLDLSTARLEERRQKRMDAARARKERADSDRQSSATAALEAVTGDNEAEDASTADPDDVTASCSHWRRGTPSALKRAAGTQVFMRSDILSSPELVSLATRLKMTPTQQAAYTCGLIEAAGGDATMIAASYATVDRARRHVVKSVAEHVRETRVAPRRCTLHWDGQLLPTLNNQRELEERLTVVVGDSTRVKLLGVPAYEKATDEAVGAIVAHCTADLLQKWGCSDNVVAMAFDTTAANTGHLTAACVAIQDELQRALLWLGCRYHVGEVILGHVFSALKLEVSKSPCIAMFERFRTHFDVLDRKALQIFSEPEEPEARAVLRRLRVEAVATTEAQKDLVRDDCRECALLTLAFLRGDRLEMRRPGALHKARWMGKILCTIKMVLLEDELVAASAGPAGATIVTRQQAAKLRAFAVFVTHLYVPWWLTCRQAVDAPYNDLKLYKNLLAYQAVDATISAAALRAFQRHEWYLTAEMVPLALFSELVPDEEKRATADAMLALKPSEPLTRPADRFGHGFGKPRFPDLQPDTSLHGLVSPDSWFTSFRLDLNLDFLPTPAAEWTGSKAFRSDADNICSLNVTNDCAERGVKLSTDFTEAARTDDHFQNILQVVEDHRHKRPNLRITCKHE